MHLTSSPVDWYAARAGGVVAYVLLSAVVVMGLTMTSRKRLQRWPRVAIEDVHRFAGLLVGTFVAIHIVTIAIDSYLPFSLGSLVIPFISGYRPAWVGLGIVAAELLAALAVTNRLRHRRLSYRTWRRAHYLNFAVWAAATVHGLGAGTDRSAVWLLLIYVVAIGSVLGLIAWRVLRRRRARAPAVIVLPAAASAAGVAVALVLVLGPLRFHPRPWNAARFTDTLDGQVLRQLGTTRGIVSMAGQGTGTQRVLVRADLLIAPGQLLDTEFQMEYLPSGATCLGHVTRVDSDGLGFQARCRMGNARPRTVTARWLDAQGSTLSGGTLSSS